MYQGWEEREKESKMQLFPADVLGFWFLMQKKPNLCE